MRIEGADVVLGHSRGVGQHVGGRGPLDAHHIEPLRRVPGRDRQPECGGVLRDADRGKVLGDEVARLLRQRVADVREEPVVARAAVAVALYGPLHAPRAPVVGRERQEPRPELVAERGQVVEGVRGGRIGVEAPVDERADLQPEPPRGLRHELPQPRRAHRRHRGREVVGLDQGEIAERGRQTAGRQLGIDVVLVPPHAHQTAPDRRPAAGPPVLQPPLHALLDPGLAGPRRGDDRVELPRPHRRRHAARRRRVANHRAGLGTHRRGAGGDAAGAGRRLRGRRLPRTGDGEERRERRQGNDPTGKGCRQRDGSTPRRCAHRRPQLL